MFDATAIGERVKLLGGQIDRAYPDGELVLLASIRGSFMFVADLVRSIRRTLRVDFLTSPPGGFGPRPSGSNDLLYDPESTLRGKHIILLEDIVESGVSLARRMTMLGAQGPRSLEVCALLQKRVATGLKWPVRFVGFEAPSAFLVGYGLDHAEHFRHLPHILSLE